ncbi:MBL fold metallo-hydrolase [Aquamicrobium sp. NLF2-7]|uniref:MBL fold metallo-hydrolase n=1 Tax=Aquamicrobium sp. NLF2-7 TaxID=2918753 RepID=UPI001EFB3AE1|nr:MBL fold metallo-hydrolase [Aquamicrobium sp. NLF2-7]MCG8272611.1 MBL fold metallo-hydrolase [Aquamicrobium sp. NLF2-7]
MSTMSSRRSGPDRRHFLGGAAALLGGTVAFPFARAFAQTLSTGSAELTVVSDGMMTLPLGLIFPDAPQEELVKLLEKYGQPTDAMRPDCNVTLVRTGDRLAIFDVGAGPNFMSSTGKLLDSLEAAGVAPGDVTDVVITHAHPDHIWGLTDDFDELVFADADYHIGAREWEFWSSPDAMAQMPEDRQTFVVGAQNRFAALDGRVKFIGDGDEVLPGIEAVETPGHTPGHLSFMVHGSEPVLIVGDAIGNDTVAFAHPEWPTASDQDPALGAKTRAALLDRLAGDKARAIGFHFPHPGAGIVERRGGAFVYVAA